MTWVLVVTRDSILLLPSRRLAAQAVGEGECPGRSRVACSDWLLHGSGLSTSRARAGNLIQTVPWGTAGRQPAPLPWPGPSKTHAAYLSTSSAAEWESREWLTMLDVPGLQDRRPPCTTPVMCRTDWSSKREKRRGRAPQAPIDGRGHVFPQASTTSCGDSRMPVSRHCNARRWPSAGLEATETRVAPLGKGVLICREMRWSAFSDQLRGRGEAKGRHFICVVEKSGLRQSSSPARCACNSAIPGRGPATQESLSPTAIEAPARAIQGEPSRDRLAVVRRIVRWPPDSGAARAQPARPLCRRR